MHQNNLTKDLLESWVITANQNKEGAPASYIPELANANPDHSAIAVHQLGQEPIVYSNHELMPVTLQSTAKMIPLIGLLEEVGFEQLFKWVKVEPTGDDFASITRLEQFGPKPSNPMVNAGAITLCSFIQGNAEEKIIWLDKWVKKLYNQKLTINQIVLASEKRTGDKNRALAYLLKSRQLLGSQVNETLDLYFTLCSYEATIDQLLYLPTLLANNGRDPVTNDVIISEETCQIAVSIMATCGLYDETGTHMVRTGLPAKSGVSGYTLAVASGKAGIMVYSPNVNRKGNSIRGEIMLELLSRYMKWHFARS